MNPPAARLGGHLDHGARVPAGAIGPGTRRRWAVLRRALRLALARHRRLLSAGCLAGAAAVTVHALSPPPPASVPVWVAARDLPAGHRLTAGDLGVARWPPSLLPRGGLPATAVGGWLAAPIRRGEPVTDARLVGPGLLAGQPPGVVALAVRVSDPASLVGVRPGARVDLLAGPAAQGLDPVGGPAGDLDTMATTVAIAALVLAALPVGGANPDGPGSSPGLLGDLGSGPGPATDPGESGVLLLGVDQDTAARIAAAQATRLLTVVMTRGP